MIKILVNPKIMLAVIGIAVVTVVGINFGKSQTNFEPQAKDSQQGTFGTTQEVGDKREMGRLVDVAQVAIGKTGFSPVTVKIRKGGQVVWTNKDGAVHGVASDPYPTHSLLPDLVSDELQPGDSFSYIFEKSGIFTYHDESSPLKFRGVVMVE